MDRWTHAAEADHPVDPHYEGRAVPLPDGRMVYWTCHTCRGEVRLDGHAAPITTPVKRVAPKPEPTMSAQP